MAKNEKNKRKYKSNEKQLNARLKGFDFSDFETYGVRGIDVYRYGMIQLEKEHKSPKEMKILSSIRLVENRMYERELDNMADEMLLDKLYSELENIKGFTKDKQEQLIELIKHEFELFIEDEKLDEDVKNDLTMFYELRRDAITNRASKFGRIYEQAIELFDNYLEDMEQSSVLENTRTSEHE